MPGLNRNRAGLAWSYRALISKGISGLLVSLFLVMNVNQYIGHSGKISADRADAVGRRVHLNYMFYGQDYLYRKPRSKLYIVQGDEVRYSNS